MLMFCDFLRRSRWGADREDDSKNNVQLHSLVRLLVFIARELISRIALIPKVIPLTLILDHSRLQKSQECLTVTNPVMRIYSHEQFKRLNMRCPLPRMQPRNARGSLSTRAGPYRGITLSLSLGENHLDPPLVVSCQTTNFQYKIPFLKSLHFFSSSRK